ncbi:MAG: NADH-quinone oxidoreductase subunit H [Candidatus Aminicenantes bacterium]|nr:NADH-quinone oxidoreductase subunit H [Candidatus Aminicenantes bacterium]
MVARIFYAFLILLGGIAYGLLLGGISRKITARLQNRRGPTIFQNFIDVWKLFRKKTAISHGVMFYLAPMFRLVGGAGTFLLVPIVVGHPYLSNFSFGGDLIVIMYFMVLGCLGMALGAAESGHPHSPIAVTRGLSLMAGYELPFVVSVVVLMIADKTTTVEGIVRAQQGGILHWHIFTHPFAAAAAFISLLGMMMSYPFQVVMAPQEIPIGPPTEYSSSFLSYMFSGRSVFAVAKYVLFMDLFLGGATNLGWAFLKTFLIFLWPLFITNVFPRFKLEQAVSFFWTWPTLIGLIDLIRIYIVR